jgi:hypothetical protein
MHCYAHFKLHRLSDELVYEYDRMQCADGSVGYNRRDRDLWIVFKQDCGWVAYDEPPQCITSRSWDVLPQHQGDHPPEGIWVSRKGSKSYVYDLRYDDSTKSQFEDAR